jgi:hypothetical protein
MGITIAGGVGFIVGFTLLLCPPQSAGVAKGLWTLRTLSDYRHQDKQTATKTTAYLPPLRRVSATTHNTHVLFIGMHFFELDYQMSR